jgi:hypothetical protein
MYHNLAIVLLTASTGSTLINYPFLNPNRSPGMNPKTAATGKPAASKMLSPENYT